MSCWVSLTDMCVGLGSEQKFKALRFVVLAAVMQSSVSLHCLSVQVITETRQGKALDNPYLHVHADHQQVFRVKIVSFFTDLLWNRKSATWSDVLSANRTAKCSAVSPFSCQHIVIKKGRPNLYKGKICICLSRQ